LSVALTALAVIALGANRSAKAAFIVDLDQVGLNVVATGNGTINLTGLQKDSSLSGVTVSGQIQPNEGTTIVSSIAAKPADYYQGFTGPLTFGTGMDTGPSSGTGDLVGLGHSDDLIDVPEGYVSGGFLSGTSTYNNQTISSLGVIPGTYTWTWGRGANADSFTLQVNSATAVPEPASFAILGTALAGFGLIRGRRRSV
jgi:hypothetical protein